MQPFPLFIGAMIGKRKISQRLFHAFTMDIAFTKDIVRQAVTKRAKNHRRTFIIVVKLLNSATANEAIKCFEHALLL